MMDLETTQAQIQKDINQHPVILFMKGNKLMPQCGFSAQVVHILQQLNINFEVRNVLEDDALRQGIKEFSDWPTIPQLYIDKEFIGGCDIITQLYEEGKLAEKLKDYRLD
jgi:monothiol glutaredoxin